MAQTGIDLTKLSQTAFREFVDSFDTILCDLDFTVWHRTGPPPATVIPGVDDVLFKLTQLGKKVIFVTNSSHATREMYRRELEECGLTKITGDVVFPVRAVGQYLSTTGFKGRVHVIGSKAQRDELRSWGLEVDDEIEYPRAEYSYTHISGQLKKDPEVKAVVVDFDPNLNYLKLMQANVLLLNPDCLFFATATEKILPPIRNVRFIATGYFSEMLQAATSKAPIETGKPHPFMGELLEKSECLDPGRTLVVGDSLGQDIGFGMSVGMRTVYVPGDHKQSPNPKFIPTYFAPTLGHLLPFVKEL